jgi:hypothetical protein
MTAKEKIIEEFNRIKKLGFIKSNRSHNTGVGKTFEDYLGVKENNAKEPDFQGFEVKSQRLTTGSYLTLFTKSPSGKGNANAHLRNTYGEEYEEYPGLKYIHTSIFSDRFNSYQGKYKFKIINDKIAERIFIQIKDNQENIIDESVFWTYQDIDKCLKKKLKSLFYVNAETKIIEGEEHFHYVKADIYLNYSLENFLKLIDDGRIMVDIRIGSYKTGKNKGKPHDHGTGFRIRPSDLAILYLEHFTVE